MKNPNILVRAHRDVWAPTQINIRLTAAHSGVGDPICQMGIHLKPAGQGLPLVDPRLQHFVAPVDADRSHPDHDNAFHDSKLAERIHRVHRLFENTNKDLSLSFAKGVP